MQWFSQSWYAVVSPVIAAYLNPKKLGWGNLQSACFCEPLSPASLCLKSSGHIRNYCNLHRHPRALWCVQWVGYIKDYDGGTLMECVIVQRLPHTRLPAMLQAQKRALDSCIRQYSKSHVAHPGLSAFQEGCRHVDISSIPGLPSLNNGNAVDVHIIIVYQHSMPSQRFWCAASCTAWMDDYIHQCNPHSLRDILQALCFSTDYICCHIGCRCTSALTLRV